MNGESKGRITLTGFIAKSQVAINILIVLLLCSGAVTGFLFYFGVFDIVPSFIEDLKHPPRYDIAFFDDTPVILPDDIIDVIYYDGGLMTLPGDMLVEFHGNVNDGEFTGEGRIISLYIYDSNLSAITANSYLLEQNKDDEGWDVFTWNTHKNEMFYANDYILYNNSGIFDMRSDSTFYLSGNTITDAKSFMSIGDYFYILDNNGVVYTYTTDGDPVADMDDGMLIQWENMLWIGAAYRVSNLDEVCYFGIDKDGLIHSGTKTINEEDGSVETVSEIIGSWDMQGTYVLKLRDWSSLVMMIDKGTGSINGRVIYSDQANLVPSDLEHTADFTHLRLQGDFAAKHRAGNAVFALTDAGSVAGSLSGEGIQLNERDDPDNIFGTWGLRNEGEVVDLTAIESIHLYERDDLVSISPCAEYGNQVLTAIESIHLYERDDLVSIFGTWGLRRDGKVVNLTTTEITTTDYRRTVLGYNIQFLDEYLEENFGDEYKPSDWKEIICVAEGENFIVGLRADGTVIAIGSNMFGFSFVSEWEDIIWIWAGKNVTIGQRRDGALLIAGDKAYAEAAEWDGTAPAVFGNALFLP